MKIYDRIRYGFIFIIMVCISLLLVQRVKLSTPNTTQKVNGFETISKDDIRKTNLENINTQLLMYYKDNGTVPDSLSGILDKIPTDKMTDPIT